MSKDTRKLYRVEVFPDGSNEALNVIMNNAKTCAIEVLWNPVMRLGCQPPKGYDVLFLSGRRKNFVKYYTNDLTQKRVSPIEYIKIIRSLF